MKTILTILVICLSLINLRAQVSENAYYYSTNGYWGNYFGGELGANFNSKVGYTVKFSASLYLKEIEIIFNTKEVISNFNLLAGIIINLDSEGKIKLRLMAGAGMSSISENRYKERYEIGNLIINPVLEFLIFPSIGYQFPRC
jgi:hypothetical protein